jgi:hypothetical protein
MKINLVKSEALKKSINKNKRKELTELFSFEWIERFQKRNFTQQRTSLLTQS